MQSRNNMAQSDGSSTRTPSIFELVERTKKFIRFELVHAGVAAVVFFAIFLVLQPWNYVKEEGRPYWMVGPPLVYFMLDLLLALMLHFRMLQELRPKSCKVWMLLQVGNLILLTIMGVVMIWEIQFVDYSYLKLVAALLVLFLYKAYRISIMHKLISDMEARCALTCIANVNNENTNNTDSTLNGGRTTNLTFASHHEIVREQILRSSNTSVQQPDFEFQGNVKQQSSA